MWEWLERFDKLRLHDHLTTNSLLTFGVSAKIEFHKYRCGNKRILFYEWVPTLDELRTEKTQTTVNKSCISFFYYFFQDFKNIVMINLSQFRSQPPTSRHSTWSTQQWSKLYTNYAILECASLCLATDDWFVIGFIQYSSQITDISMQPIQQTTKY